MIAKANAIPRIKSKDVNNGKVRFKTSHELKTGNRFVSICS